MKNDYGNESEIKNNVYGSWSRNSLMQQIDSSNIEGILLKITTSSNKTFEIGNFNTFIV